MRVFFSWILVVFIGGAFFGITGQSWADSKPIVAVFDIEAKHRKFSKKLMQDLTVYLSTKLAEGGYQVIPRDQIRQRLLQEKLDTYRSCFEQSCQIELGRELAAQKTLSVQLMKIGNLCQFTATLYDLKRSTAEEAASARSKCREEAMLKAIDQMAVRLCEPLRTLEKQVQQARTDFDKVLAAAQNIKEKKDRVNNAWANVKKMAAEEQLPVSLRGEMLKKFLAEFKEDNPYEQQARKLLVKILPGVLDVTSQPPNARVLVNGSLIGKTPLSRDLMASKYKISVKHKDFMTQKKTVELTPGDETKLSFFLNRYEPGTLEVSTVPQGAQLILAGRALKPIKAQSPYTGEFQQGSYTIEAKMEGYQPTKKEINIRQDELSKVVIEMQRVPNGVVKIDTKPPGATIEVRGAKGSPQEGWKQEIGKSPKVISLENGSYSIQASLSGYVDSVRQVQVESSKTSEVHLVLPIDYPMNPFKKWGHVTFWSGLGLMAFGGVSAWLAKAAADDEQAGDWSAGEQSKLWSGMMVGGFAAGSALMTTGAVLWLLSPGDRQWYEQHQVMVGPMNLQQGAGLAMAGRW